MPHYFVRPKSRQCFVCEDFEDSMDKHEENTLAMKSGQEKGYFVEASNTEEALEKALAEAAKEPPTEVAKQPATSSAILESDFPSQRGLRPGEWDYARGRPFYGAL